MAITVRSLSELNNYVNSLGTTKRIRLETATAKDIGTTASDIEWDTQDYIDSDTFTHSTSTSNTEVTVEVAGLYTIELNAAHHNTGAARATVYTKVQVNNVDVPGSYDSQYSRGVAYETNLSTDCSVTLQLDADDVITIEAGVEDSDAVYVIDRIPAECILHIMSIGAAGASNTWRDIDDTPTNGATSVSISSDWAAGTFVTTEDNSIAFNTRNNLSFTATAANITVTTQTAGQSGTLVIASSNLITGWGTEFDWGYQGVPTNLNGTEYFAYTIVAASGASSIVIGRV